MDAAKMFLTRGATMSDEDYWFHLYVMLSRVRHISQLLLFNLPEKNTLEQGPADWVVRSLVGLNAKAASMEQRARVAQALKKMEWTVAIRRAGGSGSHLDPIAQHFVHQTEAESTPPKPTPHQPSSPKTAAAGAPAGQRRMRRAQRVQADRRERVPIAPVSNSVPYSAAGAT